MGFCRVVNTLVSSCEDGKERHHHLLSSTSIPTTFSLEEVHLLPQYQGPTHSQSPPTTPPPIMAVSDTAKRIEDAQKQATSNPSSTEATYKDILSKGPGSTDASSRDYEAALMALGDLYRDQKKPNELADLVRATREELSNLPKAKTAKIGMLT